MTATESPRAAERSERDKRQAAAAVDVGPRTRAASADFPPPAGGVAPRLDGLPWDLGADILHRHLGARDLARLAASSRHFDALSRAAPCWARLLGQEDPAARAEAGRAIASMLGRRGQSPSPRLRRLLEARLADPAARSSLSDLAAESEAADQDGLATPETRFQPH